MELKQPQYDEYVPGPLDPDADVEAVKTYIVQELDSLSEWMIQNRQLPAFSAGYRTSDTVGVTVNNVTPTILPVVEILGGAGEQGMFWDLAQHRLVMNKVRGVVYVSLSLSVEIDINTSYVVEAYLNGVATGAKTVVDISNQETWAHVHLDGAPLLKEGDYIDFRGSSDKASSTFELIDATMTAFRIG
jgi:hypothetical protein